MVEIRKKEYLIEAIEGMDEKQTDFLIELMSLGRYPNKGDIIKLAFEEGEMNTYDTAYPIDYYRRIEQIYPNISKGSFVFDYTNLTFGELVNINDKFANRIINFFSSLWK